MEICFGRFFFAQFWDVFPSFVCSTSTSNPFKKKTQKKTFQNSAALGKVDTSNFYPRTTLKYLMAMENEVNLDIKKQKFQTSITLFFPPSLPPRVDAMPASIVKPSHLGKLDQVPP